MSESQDREDDEVDPAWWRDEVARSPSSTPSQLSFRFAAAAAAEQPKGSARAVLSVLALVTSPMLCPADWNEPFKPLMEVAGGRSPMPSDLEAEQKLLLRQVAGLMDDGDAPSLRARIYDVCWTYGDRSDVAMLEHAIKAYAAVPLEPDDWYSDGREEWHRGLELVRRRWGPKSEQRLAMATALRERLRRTTDTDDFFGVDLSETLRNYKLVDKDETEEVGSFCRDRAAEKRQTKALHLERAWEEEAAAWFSVAGLADSACASQVRVAESFAVEAERRRQGPAGVALGASHAVEQALKILRALPRTYRSQHGVEELIAGLRAHLQDDHQGIVESMVTLRGGSIDISALVKGARDDVSGLGLTEALIALGAIHPPPTVLAATQRAEQSLRTQALPHLFGRETYSSTGQKVAAEAGGLSSPSADVSGADDPRVWAEMVREQAGLVDLVVSARIAPAHEVVTVQHRYSIEYLYGLCRDNPWIPWRHELTWARGLLHGLNGDMLSAACVLVPQLEELVRQHLKGAGAHTMFVSDDGVETEKGLATILDDATAADVLGGDLVFEMKALLTDQQGPNLRNNIAHGLTTDIELGGSSATYAWWLALRLATLPHAGGAVTGESTSSP